MHAATQLPDGTVLVVGGSDGSSALKSAEIYDPGTGTWTAVAGTATGRYSHTITLLLNGEVLVAGGLGSAGQPVASVEKYTPATLPSIGSWSPTGGLNTARHVHTATLLQDGKILVTGGNDGGFNPLASSELYNPTAETWTSTSGSLGVARGYHTATLLSDGSVMVVGGFGVAWDLASSEIFNPTSKTWSPSAGSLSTSRNQHTATLLNDGTVVVAFGQNADTVTEIYMP
jgi:N-acetylneuraminic acid mutarotase